MKDEGGRMKIGRYRVPQGPQAATQPGSHGRVLLNRLRLTSKRAIDRVEALAVAIEHAELLLIHPFRDGNGRVARWLADVMAVQFRCSPNSCNTI